MKRTIRLTESELRNMISESVRRVLREQGEYDWEEYEQDPESTKDYDNDASWSNKEAADFHDLVLSKPWDAPYDSDEEEDYYRDLIQHDYKGPRYPNGYKNVLNYGPGFGTEISDIYAQAQDHLSNRDWDRLGYYYDKAEQERQSGLKESYFHRIVSETINRILRK